jgi:hypothetical protein
MTTICWTIIHHAVAPVARAATHLAGAAGHVIGAVAGRARHLVHHGPTAVAGSHSWVELVCRAIPAAIAGGGLLVPHPANPPPRLPEPPSAIIEPGPAFAPPGFSPWSPPIWMVPPDMPQLSYGAPFAAGPPPQAAPQSVLGSASMATAAEPPGVGLVLGGAVVLLLIRRTRRRSG